MRIEVPQANGPRVVYLPNEARFRLRKHVAANNWCIEALCENHNPRVKLLMYNSLEGLDGDACLDILLGIIRSITVSPKISKGWYENVEQGRDRKPVTHTQRE